MKAVRIHRFGPPEVVVIDDLAVPAPGPGQVLVKVAAAGVGPWDALIRQGKSKVSPQPPLTLGSDLAGVIEAVGPGVTGFRMGDAVYGVTNPQFCGAQAGHALAAADSIVQKPAALDWLAAASAPVVAVTAQQMLFEYAQARRGDTVMITGAAGNVGAYAVQLALAAGIGVVAVARPGDFGLLHSLGPVTVADSGAPGFAWALTQVDAIVDTLGGSTLQQCVGALKPGGKVVSSVSANPPQLPAGVQVLFFYAEVTTARLEALNPLFERGTISARVGSVLPLAEARTAHQMLAGAPHKPGKIVLQVGEGDV